MRAIFFGFFLVNVLVLFIYHNHRPRHKSPARVMSYSGTLGILPHYYSRNQGDTFIQTPVVKDACMDFFNFNTLQEATQFLLMMRRFDLFGYIHSSKVQSESIVWNQYNIFVRLVDDDAVRFAQRRTRLYYAFLKRFPLLRVSELRDQRYCL